MSLVHLTLSLGLGYLLRLVSVAGSVDLAYVREPVGQKAATKHDHGALWYLDRDNHTRFRHYSRRFFDAPCLVALLRYKDD